jgi:hypothetical protein
MTPSQVEHAIAGSRDGSGAGDHDQAFVFGRLPRALAPLPFSIRQLGRLMVLRSRLQAGLFAGGDDDVVPAA